MSIYEYVLKHHVHDIAKVLSDPDILGYFGINIDFMKLFETHPDIGDKVLCSPVEILPLCSLDIVKAQQEILESEEYSKLANKTTFRLKTNVNARFFGLPVCPELHRTVFPKNADLGCFLKVTGTVVRMTQTKMLEYHRKYVCVKCKHENLVEALFEDRYILKSPTKCGNKESRCKCNTFKQVNLVSREHCKDYQEIKIQEQVNKLGIGSIPGSMWVVLEDDLVDNCKPGDDVHICATVRRRWRPNAASKRCEVELVLQANYLEVCNAQSSRVAAAAPDVKDCFTDYWMKYEACPVLGRDRILASVCPQVYGLHLVKLAVLLTVITGSNHVAEADQCNKADEGYSTRVRGQCHLLLVGDPGTGKSALLSAAATLTPRSVLASGAGSTRAGLTCAALREDGEWQLEAGALVLADGGVCCVDELGQLREADRAGVHEAMEQQTVSIAKAGIVCKLNTRCAVLGACNPRGHYQRDEPLAANVALGTPLLSRFDLIFILLDTKNKAWDKLVSSYILFGDSGPSKVKQEWSIDKLQMYISLVGPKVTQMTKSANAIIQSYYMMQRRSNCRDPSRTTVRMLDSLVRLSQAHCRLMFRVKILPMDAIMAVTLVDVSMQDCTMGDSVDALHSTLPKYPDLEYLRTAKKLLTKLSLDHIWQEELLYYGKLLQVDHRTLENEIGKDNTNVFGKYDDVVDDSIPLTSTLITSSYFKKESECPKKKQFSQGDDLVNGDKKVIKETLAATLKKHATLNKDEKKPPLAVKTKNKRKRKEVILDVQLTKKQKIKGRKNKKQEVAELSSDDDAERMLDEVPSVNDIFREIGMDFTFGNNDGDKCEKGDKDCESGVQKTDEKKDDVQIKHELNKSTELSENKLQQFKFNQNRDFTKFYEKGTDTKETPVVVKLENVGNDSVSVESKKSVPSSQISIFESSDCEIDLDI